MVIRMAVPADERALRRLAALDCTRPLRGDALVALLDGEPMAALALGDGRAVADPFARTAELVELLRLRAAQLDGEMSREDPWRKLNAPGLPWPPCGPRFSQF
jgi:hypothetical protein